MVRYAAREGWIRRAALALTVLSAGGCGAPPKSGIPVEKWVVTSVAECVRMSGISEADCTTIIDTAVTVHTTEGTSYKTIKHCEKVEGTDKCERLEEQVWRPKPQAFLVTRTGTVVKATMLYAGKDRATVFRATDATTYDPDKPDTTEYSPTSLRRVAAFNQS